MKYPIYGSAPFDATVIWSSPQELRMRLRSVDHHPGLWWPEENPKIHLGEHLRRLDLIVRGHAGVADLLDTCICRYDLEMWDEGAQGQGEVRVPEQGLRRLLSDPPMTVALITSDRGTVTSQHKDNDFSLEVLPADDPSKALFIRGLVTPTAEYWDTYAMKHRLPLRKVS